MHNLKGEFTLRFVQTDYVKTSSATA